MSLASSPEFAALQARLAAAQALNEPGSTTPHVSVIVPSFGLHSTVLAHYAPLLGALEHRYLLPALMLPRIPGCSFVLITSHDPGDDVLDYYARIAQPDDPAEFRRRLHVAVVPDDSPRPVAQKLLERPDLVAALVEHIGGRPGVLEPWNVSEAEVELALRLGLPLNGTSPALWPLGFKSAGRRLLHEAGVPTPEGVEDVTDRHQIAAAIALIRRARPRLQRVVVKQDNSAAGDGNFIVPTQRDGRRVPVERLRETCLEGAPDWFADDLLAGGVVEELVVGASVTSPSCQISIGPDGDVTVLSTHEQVLGGQTGQVYAGCSFPADPAYAALLAEHSLAVGRQLAAAGALGRAGVDFVATRRRGRWHVFALEINLRRGGTTHPFAVLRHLVPGEYDAAAGVWRAEDGTTRCYHSFDAFKDEAWTGIKPGEAIASVAAAGLEFDHATRTGVVLHMLSALMVDGRMGVTAVGADDTEARALLAATRAAVDGIRSPAAAGSARSPR